MNIVVTGGTGFLGRSVVQNIIANTNHNLLLVLHNNRPENFQNSNRIIGMEYKSADFWPNLQQLPVDGVIHLATQYGRKGNSDDIFECNVLLPLKLLELGVKNSYKFFINTDSYFNKKGNAYLHLKEYSFTKKSFLYWLDSAKPIFPIVTLRIEHMYGPGDDKNKFMGFIMDEIVCKNAESIDLTSGKQQRDFIFIGDVSASYLRVLESIDRFPKSHSILEVGSGEATSVSAIVEMASKLSDSITKLNFGALPDRPFEIAISKANLIPWEGLGWKPETSLEDGIRLYIQALKFGAKKD